MNRLDLLKSEREVVSNLQCLSFDLIDACKKYYDHEIECIEEYRSSNPEVYDRNNKRDEMNLFSFVKLSSYGETGNPMYHLDFHRECTVRDIIEWVLADPTKTEYGRISVHGDARCTLTYEYCKITSKEFPDSILDMKVKSATSCSGWTLCDYDIVV